MKKFNHGKIIKKYSKNIELKRLVDEGVIVKGRPTTTELIINIIMAFKNVKETTFQNGSGFVKGDIKTYFIKNQDNMPEEGDTFILSNKKFKLVGDNSNDLYADYVYFIGRRVITDA